MCPYLPYRVAALEQDPQGLIELAYSPPVPLPPRAYATRIEVAISIGVEISTSSLGASKRCFAVPSQLNSETIP